MYKKSKYLYYYKEDDVYVLYSTKTGTIAIMESDETKDIDTIINNDTFGIKEININLFNELLKYDFIIDYNTNEEKDVVEKINSYLKNSKTFSSTVFITNQCNFNCGYCFVKKNIESISSTTIDKLYLLYNKMSDAYEELHISWFGGEPLLELKKMITINTNLHSICNIKGRNLKSSVVTNGYLLTLRNFLKMYDAGINEIQVTLDENSIIHNKYRTHITDGATFNTIIDNLRAISKCNRNDFHIRIRCNYFNKSIDKIDECVEIYKKYFQNDNRFSFTIKPIVNYDSNDPKELITTYIGTVGSVTNFILKYPELNTEFSGVLMPKRKWCSFYGSNTVVINNIGNIYSCDSTINNDDYLIGYIDESGSIIYNDKYNELLYDEIFRCLKCNRYPICVGSCPRIYYKVKNKACYCTETEIINFLSALYKIETNGRI
ncbi:MAG: radical SAM protein [Bacilli bacterium]|nr:radical SAM protein [Bacilli bacterium]